MTSLPLALFCFVALPLSLGITLAQRQPLAGARDSRADGSEEELRKLLDEAVAKGARSVRIPPGVYRIGVDPKGRAHVLLQNVNDLTIEAAGVELVMTQPAAQPFFAVYGCSNVTIRGLTVDCDPLQFTQGTIVGAATNGAWYDLKIGPGYPTDVKAFANPRPMSIFDRETHAWKLGVSDLMPERIEPLDAGTWRIHVARCHQGNWPIEVGDPAALPVFGQPGFTCRNSTDITFEDCTIFQSGGMAFHEHSGGGNTTLRRCRVVRRPGTNRLLSTNADGFHCKFMRKGPTVEGCIFEGMHDDGINIHSMFSRLLRDAEGSEVISAAYYDEASQAGDRVEFFSSEDSRSLGVYTIREIEQIHDPALEAEGAALMPARGTPYRIRLDRPVAARAHDGMAALDYTGSGFIIRNNVIRDIRYRGIWVKAHNGVIEGNTLIRTGLDAITLTPECFAEATFCRDVVIRNNKISGVCTLPYSKAAIRVGADNHQKHVADMLAFAHRNIVIENNVIDDVAGIGLLIEHVDGAVLRGNKLSRIGVRRVSPYASPAVAICIAKSKNVTEDNNPVSDTAADSARVVVERP